MVLSDEKKKVIYDKYGSFGLYVADQLSTDDISVLDSIMVFKSIWFKVRIKIRYLVIFVLCLSSYVSYLIDA